MTREEEVQKAVDEERDRILAMLQAPNQVPSRAAFDNGWDAALRMAVTRIKAGDHRR